MNKLKSYSAGAAVGFINGFFASGGGIVAVLVMKKFMRLEEKKAHATAISVILPLTIAGMIVYSRAGFADASIIIKASAGGIAGAALGAKLLSKLSSRYIKMGFGIVMIVASLRMFFN